MTRIKNSKGFTLIELIVVIVIIGILAAIAAVAYNQFIANAEETSVEAGTDQIVRALNAEQVFSQRDVSVAGLVNGGTAFAADTIQTWDKNAEEYVDASPSLLGDLNSALNNNTLTVLADGAASLTTAGTGSIQVSDGTYQCTIDVPSFEKTCGNV